MAECNHSHQCVCQVTASSAALNCLLCSVVFVHYVSSLSPKVVLGERKKELDGESDACPSGESIRAQSFRFLIFGL